MSKFWDKRTVGPIKALHPMTGKVIEVDPQKDAFIGSDYDLSLKRQPGLLSWYMALRDRAKTRLRDAKHAEHNVDEDIYAEIREKNPKHTETTVKMAVKKDPRMRKAFRERMDAEDMYQKLSSAVEAIIAKGWSLRGLVDNARAEFRTKDSM